MGGIVGMAAGGVKGKDCGFWDWDEKDLWMSGHGRRNCARK